MRYYSTFRNINQTLINTMRIAIIDLGTNTFNLLIADDFKSIHNHKIAVKLGEGGIQKKIITPAAFKRGVDAMIELNAKCSAFSVDKIVAFGTSAIRNASNNIEFVNTIKHETGLAIEIIDGNREAELIYKGVKLGVELTKEKSLIIDIGGGSTEFIIANNSQLFWKESFEIGVARLLEIIQPSDPILQSEIDATYRYFDSVLQSLFDACKEFGVNELIGSSGSFDTLTEVIGYRKNAPIDLSKMSEYSYNMQEFGEVYNFLISTTYAERINTKGIIPIRAEMIVMSSILTRYIVDKIGIKKMRLSTFSLKEGVLSEVLEGKI